MEGMVQDIAFAHIADEIILACVDQVGNLFIHKIEERLQPAHLVCTLLLRISQNSETPLTGSHRVIWCPYIPDVEANSNDDDVAQLLALTRGTKAELWNIGMVTAQYGIGPVRPGDVETGYLEIIEHKKPIVDASFSPDGTAIATASMDGEVKFFQVHMKNIIKPRCLHHWQPHGGKPLSSLFFLDNHKNYNPEIQFWKFAITGANDNSELKLWSCETWTCLQTIHFSARSDERIKLKPCLDLASGYLLLSDIYRKVLYVLQLHIGNNETLALILSVSEFLLPYPILSFGIVDAGIRRFKVNSSFSLDDICNDEGEEDSQLAVVVRMYLVQPKSLQECHIVFQPPKPVDRTSTVSLPQDALIFRDALSDLSSSVEPMAAPLQELPANHSSLQLNLMTPDAFNSPVKHESPASSTGNLNISVLQLSDECYSNAATLIASPTTSHDVATNGDVETDVLMGFASGGSSPSREVQEILSLQEAKCFFQEPDLQQQQPESDELTPPEVKTEPTVWPGIPILKANEVRKSEAENARRSVNTGQDMNGDGDGKIWKGNQRIESSLKNLIHSMSLLVQTVEDQATEIKELREDIRRQNCARDLEKAISIFAQEQNIIVEKALNAKDSRQNQDAIISAISQSVNNLVSTKLDDIVSSEIASNILPAIVSQLEALSHQLHIEMTQKLSATDSLLKENIMKLVHSKSVMETLSTSLVASFNPAVTNCFREYFSSFVIPAFEKACSAMFAQINDTFCKGTKDYVTMLETHMKKISEKNRDQTAHLQALSEVMKSNSHQLNVDIKKSIGNIELSVNEAVTKALRIQQATLEGTVLAAVRSRAVTPAPHVLDTQLQQHQILQLINQGQLNSAFQQVINIVTLCYYILHCLTMVEVDS